jgi:hypothetical protein
MKHTVADDRIARNAMVGPSATPLSNDESPIHGTSGAICE